MIANNELTGLFGATVNATEEAIVNALIAGRDMTGNLGHTVKAIDHSLLRDILRQHNRLIE
jgi:L-aminopeptidase/D-esterase-like protein